MLNISRGGTWAKHNLHYRTLIFEILYRLQYLEIRLVST